MRGAIKALSPRTRLQARDAWIVAVSELRVYLANSRARAALTYLECGACRDWAR